MKTLIMRKPGERLPIDDMWNIVSEVGNPKQIDKKRKAKGYLVFRVYPNKINAIVEEQNFHFESKIWMSFVSGDITDQVMAWMEMPVYRHDELTNQEKAKEALRKVSWTLCKDILPIESLPYEVTIQDWDTAITAFFFSRSGRWGRISANENLPVIAWRPILSEPYEEEK